MEFIFLKDYQEGAIDEMRFKVPTHDADSSFNTFPISINQLNPDFMSLAELLNQAGYKTARLENGILARITKVLM